VGRRTPRSACQKVERGRLAGRIERSLIRGPIVFTAVGFVLGADGLGILRIHVDGEGLRLLAELTLAMVLFTDANADFSIVKRNLGLPERLRSECRQRQFLSR
jgi:hypothetical protein